MIKEQKHLKIALVNPRVESYSSTLPPLGLLYIAAVLEQHGFCPRVFDLSPYDDRDLSSIVDYNPDIIGMTVLTDYWHRAKHVAARIKKLMPKALFIIGGVHVTALPEESLSELNADLGVIGEGELTMLELCEHVTAGIDWHNVKGILYRNGNNEIIRTPSRSFIDDLDTIPHPARHLLPFENYLVPPGIIRGHWSERSTTMMTSRGCPFSCIWCGSQCTFGHKVRDRSIDNIISEIELLIQQYRIDTIWFVDDTFTLKKQRVLEFCRRLEERKIKLTWGCQAHVKTVDEEMFRVMKKAGLVQLDFGVESGSDKVLCALKKNSSAAAVRKAFEIARQVGVRTTATFMFGSPTETEEDVEATMRLAKEIRPDFVSAFFITPYPGTELMDLVNQNGWDYVTDHQYHGLKKGPALRIYFNEKQLLAIRERFQKEFAFQNFADIMLSPRYLLKASLLLLRYPLGIVRGVSAFARTRVFNDFVFEFLNYYVRSKTTNQKQTATIMTKKT